MEVTVYKINNCGYCTKVESLMNRVGIQEYNSFLVGQDLTKEEFKSQNPTANGFPHFIIDGYPVGGLTNAVKFFVDRGMLSIKKK